MVATHKATIAFLGAGGTMGLPMAANLANAGFTVRAWNRSTDKAQPLAEDGDAVLDVIRGLEKSGDRAIWIQMSTIGIAATNAVIELAGERSMTLVDAPVLGTKTPAEAGELVVLGSGPDEAYINAAADPAPAC